METVTSVQGIDSMSASQALLDDPERVRQLGTAIFDGAAVQQAAMVSDSGRHVPPSWLAYWTLLLQTCCHESLLLTGSVPEWLQKQPTFYGLPAATASIFHATACGCACT